MAEIADTRQVRRPVQVFLDTEQLFADREPAKGGGGRDFFAGDDNGFRRHKKAIRQKLTDVAATMGRKRDAADFIHVRMQEKALAKSHRPIGALFTPQNGFALIGGDSIGDMVFQATPEAMVRLDHQVEERAEEQSKFKRNRDTGEPEPSPSPFRTELSGIEDVRLHDRTDRLQFTAEEALAWLREPTVIGGYLVQLFRPDPRTANVDVAIFYNRLRDGLQRISGGIDVRPLPGATRGLAPGISVQLTTGGAKNIALPFERGPESGLVALPAATRAPKSLDAAQHTELLTFLSAEPLVRSIDLPISVESFPAKQNKATGAAIFDPPVAGLDYPVVGIVDGGVANVGVLGPWRSGACDHLPKADRDESHGTFIAGLISGGAVLNQALRGAIEPRGCRFFDLDVLPRQGVRDKYYADIEDFFDQLEEMVIRAKREAKVRVFNMSLGQRNPLRGYAYTQFAQLLDDIARRHDVIFVVCAGNLARFQRAPWPADGTAAVQMLAGRSAADERILPPAEQLLGLTVGAINPPGVAGHGAEMPATYTCRGPGAGAARKPDLAHYGGSGRDASNVTGLASVDPLGALVQSAGTSFAAPHVAASVATIDHALEGQAPRETLLALPVHKAKRHASLQHIALKHIARDYVGFGRPEAAIECLSDDPHSITLVFSERLPDRKDIHFQFAWPTSLTSPSSQCRGSAELTLVYTPIIDAAFGEECLRVRVEASLQQEHITDPKTGDSEWKTRTKHDDTKLPDGLALTESYLLQSGLKWTPIKRLIVEMKRGVGTSSNWRLRMGYNVRAGARYPAAGVPFTVLLTIRDPKGAAPVYDEVRNAILQKHRLADITVAHRVRPRR